MQSEAGQVLERIVARKERERRAGNNIFFWGVGNAPGATAATVARIGKPVKAIFSIMKSRPKAVDVAPNRILVWRQYFDTDGVVRELPSSSLITSRGDSLTGQKKVHYALMCKSDVPLTLRRGGEPFYPAQFRNAGGTGAPIGNSQVTALLKRVDPEARGLSYEVNMSAWLTGSYWVRLTDPVEIGPAKRSQLTSLEEAGDSDWTALVNDLRSGPRSEADYQSGNTLL